MKKCFHKIAVVTMLLAMTLPAAFAQDAKTDKKVKVDSIPLYGYIYDRLTSKELPSTLVQILRPDSSFVSSAKGGYTFWNFKNGAVYEDSTSQYEIFLPRVKGDYIIKVSKDGYNDLYAPYRAEFGSRTSELKAPKLYLSREQVKQLEEVTVKASKIKVYHKGDTIVYNADAFNLPEGSMLDALVQQMPGVEIKDNKIYVNGKFVESLLLNGKEFFKGDQSVAMHNIGAYSVKNVAVYEKNEESAELLGNRDDVQTEYVMDVRLKKDYMTGTAVNADAGYGTRGRYLGRVFGLSYTNNSRFSLYGNTNNMNISNRLDENGEQYSYERSPGITTRANAGIDYNVDNATHTWSLNGSADINYSDVENQVTTNAIQYLQSVDNFLFSNQKSRQYNLRVSTNHELKLNRENWNLRVTPSFNYNKQKEHSDTRSATFDKEFDGMNLDIIDNLYKDHYLSFTQALINRNLEFYNDNSHGYNGELALGSKIKIPNSPDAFEVKGNASYKRYTLHGTTLQDIAFGDLAGDGIAPVSSLLQRRDQAVRPDYDLRLLGLARYYFTLPFGSLNASYEYVHQQQRKNSGLMLLESMAQGSMAEFAPGQIPVPDFDNSYASKSYLNPHHIKPIWSVKKKYDKGVMEIRTEPSVFLERRDLFYTQGDAIVNPKKSFWRFELSRTFIQWQSIDNKLIAGIDYSLNQETPDLLKMIDIPNTSDPMNIRLGNPDLKKSTDHRFRLFLNSNPTRYTRQGVYAYIGFTDNAFANGYEYESATGIKKMKTYNVNGTNTVGLSYWISQKLDKKDRWELNNSFNGSLYNYASMIGYDAAPQAQKVRTWGINEWFDLSYDIGLLNVRLGGDVNWRKSNNAMSAVADNSYGEWGPTARVNLKLPFGLGANISYEGKKYFGYNDALMNRYENYLNAGLSYTMLKGSLTWSLKGQDLFNQNSGLRMRVDATGRTQTQELTLGRTLMLSVAYKFHIRPKRR